MTGPRNKTKASLESVGTVTSAQIDSHEPSIAVVGNDSSVSDTNFVPKGTGTITLTNNTSPMTTHVSPYVSISPSYDPYAREEEIRPRISKVLTRPTEAHEVKRRDGGRGKSFRYMSGDTVIARLIEATGNNFSDREVWHEWTTSFVKEKDVKTMLVLVELSIPYLGTRQGIGVQIIQGGEDMYKGAYTDGLKKAATKFGVGLDLYDLEFEPEVVLEEISLQKQLGALLKSQGIRTKSEGNAAAQSRFTKNLIDLDDEEIKQWLAEPKATEF